MILFRSKEIKKIDKKYEYTEESCNIYYDDKRFIVGNSFIELNVEDVLKLNMHIFKQNKKIM